MFDENYVLIGEMMLHWKHNRGIGMVLALGLIVVAAVSVCASQGQAALWPSMWLTDDDADSALSFDPFSLETTRMAKREGSSETTAPTEAAVIPETPPAPEVEGPHIPRRPVFRSPMRPSW